jgi:hypothetical protein
MERDHRTTSFTPWIAATLLAATAAAVSWRSQPPPAGTADAPPSEFSSARALAVLADWLGDGAPRPAGSVAHGAARERLLERLGALGLEPEVQEQLARRGGGRIALVRNVLARVPGNTGGRAVLLSAHYDSVAAGPGAGDDGSGVAILLEVARALRAGPAPERDVILLFSDAEEEGLIGAHAFADAHPWFAEVGAVVNLEARGSGGPSMLFETSGANGWLVEVAARALERPWTGSLAALVYERMPNDTDFSVFRERGVPGVNLAFIGGLAHYHTALDDLAHLDPRSVQHQGESALGLVRELAARDLERPPGGEVVFADVLSAWILRWPEALGLPLALLALLVGVYLGVRAVSLVGFGRGLLFVALVAVAALFLASLGPYVAAAFHGLPDASVAHPPVSHAALVCGALLGLALAVASPLGRATPLEAWFGAFAAGGLAAVLATAFLPPASSLALVPAVAGALAALLTRVDRALPAGARAWVLVGLPLVWTALAWLPIEYGLALSFGYRAPLIVALPLAVVAVAFAPALLFLSTRGRRRLLALSAAGLLLATATACLVAPLSAERPGWLNLSLVDDGVERPHWEAQTFGNTRLPPLTRSPLFAEDAPAVRAERPLLELLEARPASDGRALLVRMRSPRGAGRMQLELPPGARLRQVRWQEQILPVTALDRWTEFAAVPPDGLELELFLPGAAPLPLRVRDEVPLPPELGRELQSLRPAWLVPRSEGDVSVLGQSFTL